jgi:hypothetical protein
MAYSLRGREYNIYALTKLAYCRTGANVIDRSATGQLPFTDLLTRFARPQKVLDSIRRKAELDRSLRISFWTQDSSKPEERYESPRSNLVVLFSEAITVNRWWCIAEFAAPPNSGKTRCHIRLPVSPRA